MILQSSNEDGSDTLRGGEEERGEHGEDDGHEEGDEDDLLDNYHDQLDAFEDEYKDTFLNKNHEDYYRKIEREGIDDLNSKFCRIGISGNVKARKERVEEGLCEIIAPKRDNKSDDIYNKFVLECLIEDDNVEDGEYEFNDGYNESPSENYNDNGNCKTAFIGNVIERTSSKSSGSSKRNDDTMQARVSRFRQERQRKK